MPRHLLRCCISYVTRNDTSSRLAIWSMTNPTRQLMFCSIWYVTLNYCTWHLAIWSTSYALFCLVCDRQLFSLTTGYLINEWSGETPAVLLYLVCDRQNGGIEIGMLIVSPSTRLWIHAIEPKAEKQRVGMYPSFWNWWCVKLLSPVVLEIIIPRFFRSCALFLLQSPVKVRAKFPDFRLTSLGQVFVILVLA